VRIHLGHHFYGAGNLGDDFMLGGFLSALRTLAPEASFTCCVPFELAPLRQRFPVIDWLPYDDASRQEAIAACDVWLGLGGSPFQSALSRWFIDHLAGDAAECTRRGKRMFFLGVGVQNRAELAVPEVRRIGETAAGIWTRDARSADHLRDLCPATPVRAAADLAHVFFRDCPPPAAVPGRVALVANFDYQEWAGRDPWLGVLGRLPVTDRVWLAQESRDLPGAERALFASLPPAVGVKWRLVAPEVSGAPLPEVMGRWPSAAWLVTSRYHAALAGAWAGSRVVVLSTNQKLASAADALGAPAVSPEADTVEITQALADATPLSAPRDLADEAWGACAAFVEAARRG
jgi:polysaccharide pyruvyl transferase WcaK-like protein